MKNLIIVLLLFIAGTITAQEPWAWPDPIPVSLTDTTFSPNNPGVFNLQEKYVVIDNDTIHGNWLGNEFVTEYGILQFTSAGIIRLQENQEYICDIDDAGPYEGDFGDNYAIILGDSVPGFWLHQRFYVPSQSKVYTFTSEAITWDYVPYFGLEPYPTNSMNGLLSNKTEKASVWATHLSFLTAFASGYCGGQSERFRAKNGVRTSNWDAFHVNRDLGLLGMGSTGILLTTGWVKDPNFKWWKIPAHLTTAFVAYKLGAEIGYRM